MPRLITDKLTQNQVIKAAQGDEYVGFCIDCGAEASSVEPDAREYRCEACGHNAVYGAEEILISVTIVKREKTDASATV